MPYARRRSFGWPFSTVGRGHFMHYLLRNRAHPPDKPTDPTNRLGSNAVVRPPSDAEERVCPERSNRPSYIYDREAVASSPTGCVSLSDESTPTTDPRGCVRDRKAAGSPVVVASVKLAPLTAPVGERWSRAAVAAADLVVSRIYRSALAGTRRPSVRQMDVGMRRVFIYAAASVHAILVIFLDDNAITTTAAATRPAFLSRASESAETDE
jgi:hypothetical protein